MIPKSYEKCKIDIKQFKKCKKINKGGFGTVYRAEEIKTKKLYAAKLIECGDDESECHKLIEREVSTLMRIEHPTIIKFIGYSTIDFDEDNNVVIFMELATNGSLSDIIKNIMVGNGPKDYTNTSRQKILVGVARGMKYLHDRNIIHRDLKPGNILLNSEFQPLITDFGMAKYFEVGHSYSQSQFGGTKPYQAPEILRGEKYDVKVDVYAFGILMFEVLTDSFAYPELYDGRLTDFAFQNKVMNEGYRPVFGFPVKETLQKLAELCWSNNPEDRPSFGEIFEKLCDENYFLEDVDKDEMNFYVEDITEIIDSTEKLLTKIKQLRKENLKLKTENEQNKDEIKQKDEEIKQKDEKIKQKDEEVKQKDEEVKQKDEEIKQKDEEMKQKDEEMKQKDEEMKQKDEEMKQKDEEIKQKDEEIKQKNEEIKQKDEEIRALKKINQQLEIQYKELETYYKKESKQIKEELKQAKEELKPIKIESNPTRNDMKQISHTIIVGGYDKYNQLGEKPSKSNYIHPSQKSSIDPSSLLSFSTYYQHSVQVTRSGKLLGIGDNNDGQISDSLPKRTITEFTEFSIKDRSGRQLDPVSAVCNWYGTLYMFSSGSRRQLVLCDSEINCGRPVFLDIGDEYPVSLFGGRYHSAAISNKGEVIFINRSSVKNSPKSKIKTVCLPDGEKAVSVACCDVSIVALSSNGRVFLSAVQPGSSVLKFSKVSELSGQEIVWVSGTLRHFLAVNREGRVFGRGSNWDGRLGLGQQTKEVSSFTEISSLNDHKIRAAYAGYDHSLFVTREGKILACGSNCCSCLLLSNDTEEEVYSPKETTITESATFCIAGGNLSTVFIGGDPPPNTPNRLIENE